LLLIAITVVLPACQVLGVNRQRHSPPDAHRTVEVVAAENMWGSIAAEIGGSHVHVVSLVAGPNADPHSYEPTAGDARALAGAQLVIANGVGYDPWVEKLVDANDGTATMLDVGTLVGAEAGSNPHRWYNPDDVQTVVDELLTDLRRLDPTDGDYFAGRATAFENVSLADYHATISAIRARFAGTPVGASESVFSMLAPALGLVVVTPPSFLLAISQGGEVTVGDKTIIDAQIKQRAIKLYVYNSQNMTPDIRAQVHAAVAAGIPVVTISETLTPPDASYQSWQTAQVRSIADALARTA
jgi:zinc/manganese transport system substrate-binding protein